MVCYDGNDIRYLLRKKNLSYTDIARNLGITPQAVFMVANGVIKSDRVIRYFEKLLGMRNGTLEISREPRDALIKVA